MSNDELRKIFRQKKAKRIVLEDDTILVSSGFERTTFEQFKDWFQQDIFDKGCHYCNTTNELSAKLYQLQRSNLRFDATRGGKRGKRLELDRRDPNLSYDHLDNLVWCCYWCNNAKSNFFSEWEFKPIGEAIGKALVTINLAHP